MTSEWGDAGRKMGWTEAVGHSVCALEALSWHSGKHFIMLHESIVGYWLLLSFGWRKPLTPLHKSWFTLLLQLLFKCKNPWMPLLFYFLSNSTTCKAAHAPLPEVVRGLWEALIGALVTSESICGGGQSSPGQGRRNWELPWLGQGL